MPRISKGGNVLWVTPLVGVWIEIGITITIALPLFRHSPCGSVDWNIATQKLVVNRDGHSPCGSVDWNRQSLLDGRRRLVTPLVGVWIEIIFRIASPNGPSVTPLVGVWIEINGNHCWVWHGMGRHSPCGSVDWNQHIAGVAAVLLQSLPLWECGLKSL